MKGKKELKLNSKKGHKYPQAHKIHIFSTSGNNVSYLIEKIFASSVIQ